MTAPGTRTPLVQAALNGRVTRAEHPAAPMGVDDYVQDAIAVAQAGAGGIHLHVRDANGTESLDPEIVNDLVGRVKTAAGIPVGISTGAWIDSNLPRAHRLAHIRAWTAPDYASVNLDEDEAIPVMETLLAAGVGIEAGIALASEVEILAASGLADRVTRILVEPWDGQHTGVEAVLAEASAIHAALDRHGITAPRLQHGDGTAAWPMLRDALARGWDTRIGLEDTLVDVDNQPIPGNAALVIRALVIRDHA